MCECWKVKNMNPLKVAQKLRTKLLQPLKSEKYQSGLSKSLWTILGQLPWPTGHNNKKLKPTTPVRMQIQSNPHNQSDHSTFVLHSYTRQPNIITRVKIRGSHITCGDSTGLTISSMKERKLLTVQNLEAADTIGQLQLTSAAGPRNEGY